MIPATARRQVAVMEALVVLLVAAAAGIAADVRPDLALAPDILQPTGPLLLLEGPLPNDTDLRTGTDGRWQDAFSTMDFHRRMMTEYLCRNYVAESILEAGAEAASLVDGGGVDEDADAGEEPQRAQRRAGEAASQPPSPPPPPPQTPPPKQRKRKKVGGRGGAMPRRDGPRDAMLADAGSSNYRDWLARSTTLEDVYRHYGDLTAEGDAPLPDFDGEVTGYATHPAPGGGVGGGKAGYGPPTGGSTGYGGGGGGGHGGGGGGGGYGGGGGGHDSYGGGGGGGGGWDSGPGGGSSVKSSGGWPGGGGGGWPAGGGGGGWMAGGGGGGGWPAGGGGGWPAAADEKGMKLKDLFELALTALAFLSFGMFVLQLIMTCFMTPVTTPMMMVATPATAGPTGTGRRRRRSLAGGGAGPAATALWPVAADAEELALGALRTLHAAWAAAEGRDGGECLRRALCDATRRARTRGGAHALWAPVWGFAMSWAAGGDGSSGVGGAPERLGLLRATALGLGRAHCAAAFPGCVGGAGAAARSAQGRRRRRRRRGDPAGGPDDAGEDADDDDADSFFTTENVAGQSTTNDFGSILNKGLLLKDET